MNAITIFRRCRAADDDIRRIDQSIRHRRAALSSITPQSDPNGGSHGSSDPDKIGRMVAEIDQLERCKEARKQAHNVEVAAACVLLDMLPEKESGVLHGYYVMCMSVAAIAKIMKYQEGYIRKLKLRGEKALDSMQDDQVAEALPEWYIKENGG